MITSEFFRALNAHLAVPADERVSLICLGIGSITNSRSTRHQLALVDCFLKTHQNVDFEIIYDPAFTPEDVELVTSRYPTVKVNPIEEWGGTGSAILYLPHVPLWLLDHCLNMRKGALEHTLVISNNLHHIKETQSKSGKFTSPTRLSEWP